MPVLTECVICKKQIERHPNQIKKAKYGGTCSKECLRKLQAKMLILGPRFKSGVQSTETGRFISTGRHFIISYTCKQCGKAFKAGRANKRKFCSEDCWATFRGLHPRLCSVADCGNEHFGHGLCRLHHQRKWTKENPEKVKLKSEKDKDAKSDRQYRIKFGIPSVKKGGPPGYAGLEEYNRRLESQNGGCGVCNRKPLSYMRHAVDHNHKTGKLRGLLCAPCNGRVLGRLERYVQYGVTLNKLRLYLEKFDPENPLLK